MKAIIMAGGEGSRLRPLTCDCPKPMLRLMGVPLMEYAVRLLKQYDIRDIAATLAYLPESITDYFGDGSNFGVKMRFYTEKTPLGTAGSVRQASDFLDERFIVLSGDGITDFDLSAALRFHRERGAKATLLLKRSACPQEYGMVVTAPDGRIRSFHEKPGRSDIYSDMINTGIYILEPELLGRIPDDRPWDFGHDFFPTLLQDDIPVYGYAADGYWCDVGDVAAYLRVHCDALDGCIHLPELQFGDRKVYISPDATIEDGACIGAYSVIGAGCRVESGAGIKRSLVFPGAKIGEGAQLRGCICGRNSVIGENAQLFEESVVGSGSRIGNRAMLPPGVKIWPGKDIPDGEHLDGNIVWGSRMEEKFVSGALMLNAPGQAARCVQACMAEMGADEVVIGRGDSSVADALWHAAVSGAMAQGVRVIDAGINTLPQLRHAMASLHAPAALLVLHDRLLPLNAGGGILSEKQQRGILKLLERQDYACPFSRITPPMIRLGDTKPAYIADIAAAFRADTQLCPRVVVFGGNLCASLAAEALQRACIPYRCEPEAQLPDPGEIGLTLKNHGQRALLGDARSEMSEVQRQLAVCWTAKQLGEGRLILPMHFTRAIDFLDPDALYMPGEDALWMDALARHSPLQLRLHTDGLYFAVQFLSLLTEKGLTLHAWRSTMPAAWRKEGCVEIPPSQGGQLLHRLSRRYENAQLGGGMRLQDDRGWAWFSPDANHLNIFAEAASMEAAGELCAFYEEKIRRLLDGQD